jgi:hypothetical protein
MSLLWASIVLTLATSIAIVLTSLIALQRRSRAVRVRASYSQQTEGALPAMKIGVENEK